MSSCLCPATILVARFPYRVKFSGFLLFSLLSPRVLQLVESTGVATIDARQALMRGAAALDQQDPPVAWALRRLSAGLESFFLHTCGLSATPATATVATFAGAEEGGDSPRKARPQVARTATAPQGHHQQAKGGPGGPATTSHLPSPPSRMCRTTLDGDLDELEALLAQV